MKMSIGNIRTASAAMLLAVWFTPLAAAESLKAGGTGGAIGTIQALAEAYRKKNPSFELTIVPNLGSTGGIKAVAAGAIDFGLSSRPLKANEQAAGLRSLVYGRTPFVIVTNKAGVTDLSVKQLASFLADGEPRWPDGAPLRLVLRPVSDADTLLLGEFSPEVKQALAGAQSRGGMVRAITDQESADQSERLPNSLGTSSLALLRSEKRALNVVAIDGVEPTIENFIKGTYPHGKTMTIVTRGAPSPDTQKFLDFIASDEGRDVLVRLGHVVVGAH